tara:strand:+ start:312 stop:665 length:354 start_codon:yes stop_codon:yes gene_type:complete
MDDSKLSNRLSAALTFLRRHCRLNGVDFYWRSPKVLTNVEVVIVGTDYGGYGSVGIDINDNELKCFHRDESKYKWATLEGFSEQEIYSLFTDDLIKEVSLNQMASLLVGAKNSNGLY